MQTLEFNFRSKYLRTNEFYAAMAERSNSSAYRQKLSDTSYWKGKTFSKAYRDKLSSAAKNRQTSTKHAKYNTDDGVMFQIDAAAYYGISVQTVINRAKSTNPKFKNWYRIPLTK